MGKKSIKIHLLIWAIILLITACSEKEKSIEYINQELTQRLQNQADSIYSTDSYVCPGVMVMIKAPDKNINMIYYKGLANLNPVQSLNPSLQAMIGSNTKTFIVTTLLQLADQGLISLEDYLSEYRPEVPFSNQIKIKHLAYMSSGLNDYTQSESFRNQYIYNNIGQPISYNEIMEFIYAASLKFVPGSQFDYCNTNTIILTKIIEDITGNNIKTEIENRFLKPLSLKKTLYPESHGFPTNNHIHGYEDYLSPGILLDVSGIYHPSLFGGAGCMISNMYDMEKWVVRLANGADISIEMKEAREEGVDIFPGIARYKTGVIDILGWYGHKGGLPGYSTLMMHHPENKSTVIIIESSYEKAVDPLIHLLYIIQTLYPESVNRISKNQLLESFKMIH